jgi:hypothetical protein
MRGILKGRKRHLLFGLFVLMALGVLVWSNGIGGMDKATLKITSDPEGAKVTVDTGQKGVTPCTLEVPPGKRKLKVKKRAFIAAHQVVDAGAAETVEVNIKLTPIPTT